MNTTARLHSIKPDELAAILLGLAALVGCAAAAAATPMWPPAWALLVWTITLTASINLGIVFESSDANFASVIIPAALLALGVGPAALITVIGVTAGEVVRLIFPRTFEHRWRGVRASVVTGCANISMHGLSLIAAAALYGALGGTTPIVQPQAGQWIFIDFGTVFWPLLGLFVAYFVANYFIFGLYLYLEGKPVREYARLHWRDIAALEVVPSLFSLLLASTYLNVPLAIFASVCVFIVAGMVITHNLSRARARLQRRLSELKSLSVVGQAVAGSLELPDVLEAIYRQTRQLMDARYFYIALYQADDQMLVFPLAYENDVRVRYDSRRYGTGITEHVIALRQPLLIKRNVRGYLKHMGLQSLGPIAQSWLGVPIVFGDQVLGVIGVQNLEQPDRYDEANRDILVAIAAQAATAIHNAQTYLAARHHTTQLALLNSISMAVSSTLDLRHVLDAITTSAGRIMGSQKTAIFLVDDDGQHLSLAAGHNLSAAYAARSRHLPLDMNDHALVARTRRPLIVDDVDTHAELADLRLAATQEGFRALAEVPVQTHAQLVGTLTVYYAEPHRFTQSEIDLLNTLANQAAVAVTNAQLYARTDEALTRRIEQLAALEQIGRKLAASLEVDHVVQHVLDQAMSSTGAACGAIALWQPDRPVMRPMVTRGYAPADEARLRVTDWPVDAGVIGRAIQNGEEICINDVTLDPDYTPTLPTVRSALVVPIKNGQRVLGIINLECTQPACFDQPAVDFVCQLATQAALALQNAQHYAATVQARDELRAILDSAHDGILMFDTTDRIVMANARLEELLGVSRAQLEGHSLSSLIARPDLNLAIGLGGPSQTLAAQLAQLHGGQPNALPKISYALPGARHRFVERTCSAVCDSAGRTIGWMVAVRDITEERDLQRMRDDLTSTIVHDLRSPLASILSGLYLLQEMTAQDQTDGDIERTLAISIRSTRRLLDLINSLLDISKLQTGQALVHLRPASLTAVIDAAVEHLSPLAEVVAINLRRDLAADLPPVLIDPDIIGRVITNLIDNALKFTPSGGLIRVSAAPDEADHHFVRCAVRDTGPGIPPEHRTRIFERFVQLDDQAASRRGSGLGLNFCQLAVEAHGGRIWVDDAPGGGSEFVFTLQRAEHDHTSK